MKSKDLIKLLQEADPTGETHVVVNNSAITDVYANAGYWDGCGEAIVDGKGKYITDRKIQINACSIRTMCFHDPEFEVEYTDYTEKYRKSNDDARKFALKIELNVKIEAFQEWCEKTFKDGYLGIEEIARFYKANQDLLENAPQQLKMSRNTRNKLHWEKVIGYDFENEKLFIENKNEKDNI